MSIVNLFDYIWSILDIMAYNKVCVRISFVIYSFRGI